MRSSFASALSVDRLFLALHPNTNAREDIDRLESHLRLEHRLRGKRVEPSRYHITLHHAGDYLQGLPQAALSAVGDAAAAVATPPFDIVFDRVMSFSGHRGNYPLVLRCRGDNAALTTLHQALGMAMSRAGLGLWIRRDFNAHLTLLYSPSRVAEQAVEPIGWTVRDFILVHSLVGLGQHVVLGRWPLRG